MAPPCSPVSGQQSRPRTLTLTFIPGLPNDLAALILLFVPYSHHSRLRSVSKSWRLLFSSRTIISLRRKLLSPPRLSHLLCIFPEDPSITSPCLFDPRNLSWCLLPPMPCNPHVYGLCNFTSIAVGPHLYILGGSLFDTRTFPLDVPSPSSSAFRFDFSASLWESLSPMITPRGSFACAAIPNSDKILVAGGGSRHNVFGAAGSSLSSVEMYDIGKDEWVPLDGLPGFRAGCVGFFVGQGEEDREFWVMGGYGNSRTISNVLPVDQYYKDAVVMELKNGGKWKEIGDMWEEGERGRLGKIVVVEGDDFDAPAVFMLEESNIFRYQRSPNRWLKETSLPKKTADDKSVGFVGLDGELYVMTFLSGTSAAQSHTSRQHKSPSPILTQIYHPKKKSWRLFTSKPPFNHSLDFSTAILCSIHL
ncbi:unnamed protein product [Cuscuta campestris]|uniref:F-box domain-containing protein n=1 Tax=Cuscuta campestris TaxID=132261 RepID=A0A484NQ82_9ASTE|nr:unnamed protein product [Cuscuta campestris]